MRRRRGRERDDVRVSGRGVDGLRFSLFSFSSRTTSKSNPIHGMVRHSRHPQVQAVHGKIDRRRHGNSWNYGAGGSAQFLPAPMRCTVALYYAQNIFFGKECLQSCLIPKKIRKTIL